MVVLLNINVQTPAIKVFHVSTEVSLWSINNHVFVYFSLFVSCAPSLEKSYVPTWVVPTVSNSFTKENKISIDVVCRNWIVLYGLCCNFQHFIAKIGKNDFVCIKNKNPI